MDTRTKINDARLTADLGIISDSDATDGVVSFSSDFTGTSCTMAEQHMHTKYLNVFFSAEKQDVGRLILNGIFNIHRLHCN